VDAITYFTAYFNYYNNERLHGKIGYVTPVQRHRGEDKAILALRRERLIDVRKKRLLMNRTDNVLGNEKAEKYNNKLILTNID
jgi:hypothetical protein